MKEENPSPLKKALANLPAYSPGPEVWAGIEQSLDRSESQANLQTALQGLPSYTPPAAVWERIARELPREKPLLRRIANHQAWLRVAAVLLLAIGSFAIWNAFLNTPRETVTLSLRAEPAAYADLFSLDDPFAEEDETLIREAVDRFSTSLAAKKGDQYTLLLSEWDELNDAKNSIEEALHTFGNDPDLIRELKDVELARSRVVREMARRI